MLAQDESLAVVLLRPRLRSRRRAPERRRDLPAHRHRGLHPALGGRPRGHGGLPPAPRRADRAQRRRPRRPPPQDEGRGRLDPSVFPRASTLACAADLYARFGAVTWHGDIELRVRIALHTGEAHERAGDYFGPALNRAARLRGWRTAEPLLSQATMEIVHDRPAGGHGAGGPRRARAAGLSRPERVFELRREGEPGAAELPGADARDPEDGDRAVRRACSTPAATTSASTPRCAGASSHTRSPASERCSSGMGTVEEYPGDVLMAVFGVPLLHEDDAPEPRARGRAAPGAAVAGRRARPGAGNPARARVGAATGEVIAERGSGGRLPSTGATVSRAGLEELAGSDEIPWNGATLGLVRESVTSEAAPSTGPPRTPPRSAGGDPLRRLARARPHATARRARPAARHAVRHVRRRRRGPAAATS